MQLHHLKGGKKQKKRVGRGGKRGTTAGRGTKGQKSRAGSHMRPAVRDLLMRIPKKRGVKNTPITAKSFVLRLETIVRLIGSKKLNANEISKEALVAAGIISRNFKGQIKLLGDGTIKESVIVSGLKVSKSARAKIEKAGGKIT